MKLDYTSDQHISGNSNGDKFYTRAFPHSYDPSQQEDRNHQIKSLFLFFYNFRRN